MLTDHFNTVHTVMMKQLSLRPEDVMGNLSLGLSVDHVLAVTVSGGFGVIWKVWGPQYVFLLAAACSAVHLAVAGYLEKSGIVKGDKQGCCNKGSLREPFCSIPVFLGILWNISF